MKTKLSQRIWLAFAALISTAALIASCGGAPQAEAPQTGQPAGASKAAVTEQPATAAAEAKPAAGGEQVTLRWYLRWDQARLDNVAKPVIEAFQKDNPNIKIEIENVGSGSDYWTKLQTMIAGGTAPDIVYPATHNGYALASKGALLSLDEYITRDNLDLTKFNQSILDLYRYDGKLYGLPLDTAALVVFYNKKMFDEAGVAYPKDGWTWDDFLAAAQALTKDANGDGQPDQFGVDMWTEYWPVIIWTKTGHGIFDDLRKPTRWLLNEPDSVAALQWLADLSGQYKVMPTEAQRADISDMFVAGKAAMKIVGHWRVPQYQKNIKDFEWNVAALPQGKIAANRSDGSAFAISAQSKHPEEAWKFVRFLAGPGSYGVQLLLDLQQMTPALLEFQQSDVFLKPKALPGINKQAFLAGRDHLFPLYDPIHPVYDEINSVQQAELTELWNGKVTAQEAVDRMQPQIEQVLQSIK